MLFASSSNSAQDLGAAQIPRAARAGKQHAKRSSSMIGKQLSCRKICSGKWITPYAPPKMPLQHPCKTHQYSMTFGFELQFLDLSVGLHSKIKAQSSTLRPATLKPRAQLGEGTANKAALHEVGVVSGPCWAPQQCWKQLHQEVLTRHLELRSRQFSDWGQWGCQTPRSTLNSLW